MKQTPIRRALSATALIAAACAFPWSGGARADLLQNGSFEDLTSSWTNTGGGYDGLGGGSTAIAGWTVAASTEVDVAWGNGDLAYYPAADGSYFVDLTGYGYDSPHGALQQAINVVQGATYTVDLYAATLNDDAIGVSVDGINVALSTPQGNGYLWTLLEGTFVAGSDLTPVFTVFNIGNGAAALIDAASVTGAVATDVPEPAGLGLAGLGLAFLAQRWRRSAPGLARA